MYVTCVAYIDRIVQCGYTFGYSLPPDRSTLRASAKGIRLPDVLAKYIESIGSVRLTSGCVVAPYCGTYAQLFPEGHAYQVPPTEFLQRAGRDIPDNHWRLDTEWIINYNANATRASKSGVVFRPVRDELEGRNEMIVSYEHFDDRIVPYAPEALLESEAQLGACYAFRQANDTINWLGGNKYLLSDTFEARAINPDVHFSDACIASFCEK